MLCNDLSVKATPLTVLNGLNGNLLCLVKQSRRLGQYVSLSKRLLFKWLNRRSQRRSVTWDRFNALIAPSLPRPRIIYHLYPTLPWMTPAGSRMG